MCVRERERQFIRLNYSQDKYLVNNYYDNLKEQYFTSVILLICKGFLRQFRITLIND
jgi:hypothetical protein